VLEFHRASDRRIAAVAASGGARLMGEIVRFRHRAPPAPAPALYDHDPEDEMLAEAYGAAFAAAERYERERRKERELYARVEALTRENAKLKAELAKRRGAKPRS
jgi:hypothetical protein